MNKLRRSWWKVLATLLAFTLISAACGSGDSGDSATGSTEPPRNLIGGNDDEPADTGEGPQYGGRIIVGIEGETTNWLPGSSNVVVPSGSSIGLAIFDPLVHINGDGVVEPYLAESLEPNSDLTEWTLKVREGVKFHDGSDLNAEVLLWNYQTLHDVASSTTDTSMIDAVEIVDDYTIVYKLNEANAAFPDRLRNPLGWPISQEAYEELGADALGENPVGTGPFMFKQWTRDDRLVVERNPNYWRTDGDGNKLPYLDEVEFRPIPDEESRYQSLAADSVQVMVTLRGSTAKLALKLVEERDYMAYVFVGNQSGSSIFNILEPPVDDIRVREALIRASDGDDVAVILGDDGLVPRTNGFFSPDSPWYSEVAGQAYFANDGVTPESLDIARGLIEDYKNDPERSDGRAPGSPIDVTYSCPPDPSLIEIGQYYQQMWGDLGVTVTLEQVEQPELVQNALGSIDSDPPLRGNFMINCWRASGGEGDPYTTLRSWFADPETNMLNFTNFSHPEIDEALEVLRTSTDFDTRYAAVETINRINNENATMTWSIATPALVGWRDDVQGLVDWVMPSGNPGNQTPGGHMHFSQVWLRS